MRIKNLNDLFYMVRFGLLTVSFPALFQGLWAGITAPFLEASYKDPKGGFRKKRLSLPRAFWNLCSPKKIPLPEDLGKVLSWENDGGVLRLSLERGFKEVKFLAPDVIRVRVSRKKMDGEPQSFAVVKGDWPPVSYNLEEGEGKLLLKTEEAALEVSLTSGLLSLFSQRGKALFKERAVSLKGEGTSLSCDFGGDAQFYGLGEKASSLNHRGKRFRLWNSDPVTYDYQSDPLYSSIPFFLVLRGRKFLGIFLDNPSGTFFDFGSDSPSYSFGSTKGELVFYLFLGPSGEKVLAQYSELTGKPPLPPLWSLGYHQSRWSYDSEEEVRRIAWELRRRKIPCDAIHLDIDYMDGWRCFTWDKKRFPDPEKLSSELKKEGFKLVPNVDCGIKRDFKYWAFKHGVEKDVFLKTPDGKIYYGPVWPGYAAFPDFTESRVRKWWKELNATLVEVGMAGVENDMDEPSVFGRGTVPNFLLHRNEGKPIYHEDCHNAYGLLVAKSSWEAWRDLRPEERPFVLTRSTYAGGQRYGATWTADNQSTWEHLWLSIPMCLNLALSGFSFVGVDVGGFARHATGELLVRWTQLGAFLPFFRNHCAKAMHRQEPWAFGQPYEDACRKAIELRYELLPYLYSAFFKCSQAGFPVIRPLIFDWPEIEEFQKEDREFLFGDSLLLAPVLEEKARVREVLFPPGAWCDYFSGKPYSSGKAQVEVDLFSIPLFVKSGAIIPTWKVQQFIGEELPQEVILRLYPGEGVSFLYEDDGLSMAYREGKYLLTRMVQSLTGEGIEVEIEREGEENLGARVYTFRVMGLKAVPEKVEVDGKDFAQWIFEGGVLTFTVERPMRIKIALRKD